MYYTGNSLGTVSQIFPVHFPDKHIPSKILNQHIITKFESQALSIKISLDTLLTLFFILSVTIFNLLVFALLPEYKNYTILPLKFTY